MLLQSSATMKYSCSSVCRVPPISLHDFRGHSNHCAMRCRRTYRYTQIATSRKTQEIVVFSSHVIYNIITTHTNYLQKRTRHRPLSNQPPHASLIIKNNFQNTARINPTHDPVTNTVRSQSISIFIRLPRIRRNGNFSYL